jgi:hypothetical protein
VTYMKDQFDGPDLENRPRRSLPFSLRVASVLLSSIVVVALGACGADPDVAAGPDAGAAGGSSNPDQPGDTGDDPSVCLGDGGSGTTCEVTGDCEAPLVCLDGVCVGPQDPDVSCDPIEGIGCEGEDEQCVAGVCVTPPDECETTDQCPVGYLCADGQCKPDRDGEACEDPGPGPELTGTWSATSNLYLRDGLPGLADGLLELSETFRDFIQGDADFGLPPLIQIVVNSFVASVIDQYVPEWAQDLVLAMAGISDVLDTMQVDSTIVLEGQPCDAHYRGSSVWDRITFEYDGQVITAVPGDIPEIGAIEPEDFGARYSCGDLYIDRHRVHNTLSGLVRWLLNTVVEISTGHPTPEEAIGAAIDCQAIAESLNDAYQQACDCNGDITVAVEAACTGFESQLITDLQALVDDAAVQLSVLSLQGVAEVADEDRLAPGQWYGSVLGGDFPGDFTAVRQ